MNIFSKLFKSMQAKNEDSGGGVTIGGSSFADFFRKNFNGTGPDMSELTYYTCLKVLSETMGKLPCYIEAPDYAKAEKGEFAPLSRILEVAPNEYQTAAEFFDYLEKCRNHFGNAYAYIKYNNHGTIEGIYPLNPRCVVVYINNSGNFTDLKYWYQYADATTGKTHIFLPEELIHLKSWITEPTGHIGKAAREILAEYMTGNKASQEFLNDLYRNGLTANLAVKYTGPLSHEAQSELVNHLNSFLRNHDNRVLPVSNNFDLQPLDLKLTDSQFLEIKKYSATAIAAAFGLPPTFLNDYSKSSYASSSAQNTAFYVNTLLYTITLYEMELSRKLLRSDQLENGYRIKYNINVILRADPAQQAEMLAKYVANGIYTINEAREKAGLPPVKDGNINVVNGSCQDISKLGDTKNE